MNATIENDLKALLETFRDNVENSHEDVITTAAWATKFTKLRQGQAIGERDAWADASILLFKLVEKHFGAK